ncbi:ORC-CDC6 family AAA ATPase [Viscerimonas tarda]
MFQQEIDNPFQYLTPESINAEDTNNLFVDVFKDYYQVLNIGNTFIHGPRGSGKSMMFRVMKSDCQMLRFNRCLKDINFYGIYIPIKNTYLNIAELRALEDMHGGSLLNEHYLVIYFSIMIFDALSKEDYSKYSEFTDEVFALYKETIKLLKKAGYNGNFQELNEASSILEYFMSIKNICSDIQSDFFDSYLTKIILGNNNLPYTGVLCLYSNFLFPILKKIQNLSFLPSAPLFLLIDDADELGLMQTKVLNSWVSYRNTDIVSFKISTQLRYQTYFTTKGSKIDSPHDYFEITLNQAYTSNQERYKTNITELVMKRLELHKKKGHQIDTNPTVFFPCNEEQQTKITELFKTLESQKLKETGDVKKAYDYAYRNTRPDYMKNLSNKYSYSYAGFEQLVHLSSGIIRNFLDLSAMMYTTTYNRSSDKIINEIPVSIQDEEIENFSTKMITSEFDKLLEDKHLKQNKEELNKHNKLKNLLEALGQSFRIILLSNSSERRKFSFYFGENLSEEIRSVLKLGVIYGYFHESTLGSKSGLGRSPLYILNRMLAPYYKLDPLSFSGYLHLTADMIELGMMNPKSFISKIKRKDYDYDSEENQKFQLQIEFEHDNNESNPNM